MKKWILHFEGEIYCSCGRSLCNNLEEEKNGHLLRIEPCKVCLQQKYDMGYVKGCIKSLSKADREDFEALTIIMKHIYWHVPSNLWGSLEKVKEVLGDEITHQGLNPGGKLQTGIPLGWVD